MNSPAAQSERPGPTEEPLLRDPPPPPGYVDPLEDLETPAEPAPEEESTSEE